MEIEETLAARSFVLVDSNDQPAMVIGMLDDDEGPGIGLLDSSGRQRLVITTTEDGPAILMKHADGSVLLAVGLVDGVMPTISLKGADDAEEMWAAVTEAGPAITLSRSGVARVRIVLADTGPRILLKDTTGTTRVEVSHTTADGPAVRMMDPEGVPLWSPPTVS